MSGVHPTSQERDVGHPVGWFEFVNEAILRMSDVSGFLIPAGFRFAAVKAGLKASGRTDFAVIVADEPASAAAVYTANRISAAPIAVDKAHLQATGGRVRV